MIFDNVGTGQSLSGSLGGCQYTIYGGIGPTEKRSTDIVENGISIGAVRNDPINPPSKPGIPVFAVKREAGYKDLEVMISNLSVIAGSEDLYFYL